MDGNERLRLLPDMAAFVQVVEGGSFTAAARQLGVAPSSVSRQVSRLEKALGLRLLERNTRALRLTEAGSEAFAQCQALMQAAEAVTDIAERRMGTVAGQVRLSMPKALGRQVIAPRLGAFLRRYPEVDLHLRVDDRLIDPVSEAVDLAIRITDQPPPGLIARRLFEVHHWLCAAPAYLTAHGTPESPADLARHQCIVLGETPDDAVWHLRQGVTLSHVRVHGRILVNHSELRLEAARDGFGIACVPHFTAESALARGELVRVLAGWRFMPRSYNDTAYLLYPPGRMLQPKVRALIDYLADSFGASPDA